MIKNVSLIVYDFDGVMTNNKVLISQDGTEMVQVNRADGLGVSEINKLGINEKTSIEGIVAPGILTLLSATLCYGLADKIYP